MVLFKQIVFKCQINQLFEWFCSNKLSLNAKKPKIYCFTTKTHERRFNKIQYTDKTYQILDRIGNDCDEKSTKFLGMHIDENLTWKYHVNKVKNKVHVARALFFSQTSKKCITNRMSPNVIFALLYK